MSMLAQRTRARQDATAADAPVDGADPGVTVHRRRGALALVGAGALAVAVAYTWRAATGGGALGYVIAAVMLPVAVLHLAAWWDARVPLLVADRTGLRLRDGRSWTGLRWEDAPTLRLTPSQLPRRDGRLAVVGDDGRERELPLSLVDPADVRALPDALRLLAGPRTDVSIDVRAARPEPEPDPPAAEAAEAAEALEAPEADEDASSDLADDPAPGTDPGPDSDPTRFASTDVAAPTTVVAASGTPERRVTRVLPPQPARAGEGTGVARADVVHQSAAPPTADERELRDAAPGRVPLVLETPTPPAEAARTEVATTTDPVIDAEPAAAPVEPVIGPQLVEARNRLRMSVDDLAERTRIRPHVIEAIEVDDFSSCGGDVYARGHLRALARVLGVDPEPIIGDYDARYGSAPVTARRVFEAELAGPGRALRPTSGGGPRWAVLIGVVLVLVLVWALARLLVPPPDSDDGAVGSVDRGAEHSRTHADRSASTSERFAAMGERPDTTRLRLAGVAPQASTEEPASETSTSVTPAPTPVVVRADSGDVVFRGAIGPGEVRRVEVAGPATVSAGNAGAVTARVNGKPTGPLGATGDAVRTTLGPR